MNYLLFLDLVLFFATLANQRWMLQKIAASKQHFLDWKATKNTDLDEHYIMYLGYFEIQGYSVVHVTQYLKLRLFLDRFKGF